MSFFSMQWGDDRSLNLVKTVSAIELWQLLIGKNKSNFWLSHRRTLNGTILVSVSYRLVPYLTLAFSHQALNLSYAWHIVHACARYVILLENSQTISGSAVVVFPVFQGSLHICITVFSNFMISLQVRLYNNNGSPRVLLFTSSPLHVGIVSLSCYSVPL